MTDNDTARPLRITGPADLLQAVPYLLGFHPAESLVLIGLADGRLVVTARIGLADVGAPALLRDSVAALCRGGAEQLVAAVYSSTGNIGNTGSTGNTGSAADGPGPDDGAMPWHGLVDLLGDICLQQGCALGDVLRVCGDRWWSYRCADERCCPVEGRPLPETASAFVAEATYAGVVALPDRAALAATLDPVPREQRDALEPLIAAHENAAVQAVLEGGWLRMERAGKRAIFAAARRADAADCAGVRLNADDTARFGVLLSGVELRDAVWLAVDDRRLDGRELWRELARGLPEPYNAGAFFLYGWASWRAGNGALATMAAERTLASDPAYSAADLLLEALRRGIDPRRMPRLRGTRSAAARPA